MPAAASSESPRRRHDRLEFAAALAGLVACLALLVPAVLDLAPARALRPVFGVGPLGRVPLVALFALWLLVVLIVRARPARAHSLAREDLAAYMLVPAMVGLGVVIHQLRSQSSFRSLPLATAVAYGAVALIGVLAALREIAPLHELPRRAWRDVRAARGRTWAKATALAAVTVAAVVLIPHPASSRSPWASVADFEQWYRQQERKELPVEAAGTPVTIVKFQDYQCPPCRRAFEQQQGLADRYAGTDPPLVATVTRDYPLDAECNPKVRTAIHPLACEAAVAVRLADRNHRGQAMAAWLYQHQAALSREAIVQAAGDVGGVDDFQGGYIGALEEVKADVALGNRLGVDGTPTLFVNGVKLDAVPRPYLEAAIAYELRLNSTTHSAAKRGATASISSPPVNPPVTSFIQPMR